MSLSDRVEKAKSIVRYGLYHILQRDSKGIVRVIVVPGSEGKQYHIILRREGSAMSAECRLSVSNGEIDCEGAMNGICYHAIVAVEVAAKEKQLHLAWTKCEEDATRRSHLGGHKYRVISRQSGKSLWAVAE